MMIYNTLTNKKELFNPIIPKQIGIYVCGLTVYDHCHLGHGRLFIWFDTLIRYLKSIGYKVLYIRNITDIDDKIIRKSQELGISCKNVAQIFIDSMHENEKMLNILSPNFEPRVTEHIVDIIEMIKILISKKFAYITENGDVYYNINKFVKYGNLANRNINELITEARIENNKLKKNSLDFVLWKATKLGEPFWHSPWGNGRPGWHIECSAMATKYLGKNFDIHGGGIDLQFPHHQNELAQSEAANESEFANFWMHVGFVQNNNEKMSKSTNNYYTLKDILNKSSSDAVRLFMLQSHYRSPINFSDEKLIQAELTLNRLYILLSDIQLSDEVTVLQSFKENKLYRDFHLAMEDDFNTPKALSILFEISHEIRKFKSANQKIKVLEYSSMLINLGKSLGLFQDNQVFLLNKSKNEIENEVINKLMIERKIARKSKNWKKADEIREQLLANGIIVEDGINGSTWKIKKI